MKIFISYARVDKPFCVQLVDTLHAHAVWYDYRLYAGQHWWREILRRLEWCDGFIYILSPDSVESEYCRQEFDIAQRLGRVIIPVLMDADTAIPDELSELQYVDMSDGLSVQNVSLLLSSIFQAEREQRDHPTSPSQKSLEAVAENVKQPPFNMTKVSISDAAEAMQKGKYDDAILLLEQAKSNGFISRFIQIDTLLREAKRELEEQAKRREAEREYRQILELFHYKKTRKFAHQAFVKFQKEFPDYDPNGLREYIHNRSEKKKPGRHTSLIKLVKRDALPLLKWRPIPDGKIRMDSMSEQSPKSDSPVVSVSKFLMAKYPIINLQFDCFVNADDGYHDPRWWTFRDEAMAWHETHPQPLEPYFRGKERPRENVNWYEAMAFCQWLSHRTDVHITLPTLAQWQYAAQGDDDRYFPWGNTYHPEICNTMESGLRMTTNVRRYGEGASPFDVIDMAGNVWEWCLDYTDPDRESSDHKRAMSGGSFLSPYERAKATFRYFMNPESRYSSIGFRIVAMPK